MIYHYTDATGLIGIIESKVIRATSVWFMNDTAEATFGWKQVERFVTSKVPQSEPETKILEATLKAIYGIRDREDFVDSYISCFSEKCDLLSQWRAYGRDKGFSIGFDRDAINELARAIPVISSTGSLPATRKVAYTEAEHDLMLESHYHREITSRLSTTRLSTTTATYEAVAGTFLFWAIVTAPSIKCDAFQEEAEIRLHFFVNNSTHEVKFRDSAMGVTPYIEMSLCKSAGGPITAIREVIVGPQRHSAEARRAVQALLARNGLADVEVKESAVPLRV